MAGRIWGFFLFTIHIKNVYNYILNQENHHHKKTFKEEYIDFFERFEIEYDEKYLFDWKIKLILCNVIKQDLIVF